MYHPPVHVARPRAAVVESLSSVESMRDVLGDRGVRLPCAVRAMHSSPPGYVWAEVVSSTTDPTLGMNELRAALHALQSAANRGLLENYRIVHGADFVLRVDGGSDAAAA